MKWYYEKNEEPQGPFSLEEILPVITPVTLVWRENSLGDWVEAQKHPLLKTIFAEPNNISERIHAPIAMPVAAPTPQTAAAPTAPAADTSNLITIKSPIFGTFYRSAGPGEPVFVNVGDEIKAGKALCIIEVMTLFNEIESEVSGTIVKVLVDDATPVEYDQPLFLVQPLESSAIENIKNPQTNDIHITLSFDGVWMILDAKVKVYADDVLVGTGSLKNGFHIEFSVTKKQPLLIVKHAFRSQKIEINKLEIGRNYEIILGYDRYLKGNFNSAPVKIIKT